MEAAEGLGAEGPRGRDGEGASAKPEAPFALPRLADQATRRLGVYTFVFATGLPLIRFIALTTRKTAKAKIVKLTSDPTN